MNPFIKLDEESDDEFFTRVGGMPAEALIPNGPRCWKEDPNFVYDESKVYGTWVMFKPAALN